MEKTLRRRRIGMWGWLFLILLFLSQVPDKVIAHGGNTNLIHACINNKSKQVRIVGAYTKCFDGETPIHYSLGGAELTFSNGLVESDGSVSIIASYRLPQNCTVGQVAKWNDDTSLWDCANDDTSSVGDGVGYDEILDEGSALAKRSKLNFIGTVISCVDNLSDQRTDCTVTGDGQGVTSVTAASPLVSSGGTTPEISCPGCLTEAVSAVTAVAPITSTGGNTPEIACATCVTNVTATSPITSTGGTTPTIACPTCITSNDGVGYDQIQDEGTNLTKRGTVNFVGSGVNCVDDSTNNRTNCTVSGGSNAGFNHVVLAADVVDNSGNNTIQDVTGLSFNVLANKTYVFRAYILYTSAASTTGSRWSINGPANPTYLIYTSRYTLTSTTQTLNAMLTAYDLPSSSNATSNSPGGNIAIIEGMIRPSANGTVIMRMATEVSGSAITALAGSLLEWRQTD